MPAENVITINTTTVIDRAREILTDDGPETAVQFLENVAAHPCNNPQEH